MGATLMPSDRAISEFSFESVAIEIGRSWLLLSVATLVGALALYGASNFVTPAYRATVIMVPTQSDGGQSSLARLSGQLGGLAALAGISMEGGAGTKQQDMEYLRSRQFTSEFLQDEQLLPILFADEWDSTRRTWKDERRPRTLSQGVRYFNREVRALSETKETGMITLTITWTDRKLAERWANGIVDRVNARLRQRAILEAEASIRYLELELQKTNIVELRQSIYRLIEGQIKAVMLANVRKQYAFKVIDPAVVPDGSDLVRPRKLVMTALGGAGALLLALVFVLWRTRARFMASSRAIRVVPSVGEV